MIIEKYRITDHNGRLKVLVVQKKYMPDMNDGAGGYEDVIAIREPSEFRPT